jgi:hypothetical protein
VVVVVVVVVEIVGLWCMTRSQWRRVGDDNIAGFNGGWSWGLLVAG